MTSTPLNIQRKLVSGTNIKTINGDSVLGSGDLEVGDVVNYWSPRELFTAGTNGFWLDASVVGFLAQSSDGTGAVAADGDPVGYIKDIMGGTTVLTQTTSGSRPTWQNGSLRFDGTDDFLFSISALAWSSAWTMLVVFKSNDATSGTSVICGRDSYQSFYETNDVALWLASGSTTQVNLGRAARDRKHLFVHRRTSDTVAENRYDGGKVGDSFNPSELSNVDYFVLGAATVFGSLPGKCDIDKVIMVNRALTDAELEEAETYLLREIESTYEYDVFLIAGQSNTYYGATLGGSDVSNAYTYEWTQKNEVSVANDPLDTFIGRETGKIGFIMSFCRDYIASGKLKPGRRILLVHCGYGGTGFNGSSPTTWANVAGSLREQTIERTTAAVLHNSGNELKGIFWVQGESDQAAGGSFVTNYQSNLTDLFTAFREIPTASECPIIIGSMTSQSVAAANGTAINAAHVAIPAAISRCAYVNNTDFGAADIHFSAAEQRVIGKRMFAAWRSMLPTIAPKEILVGSTSWYVDSTKLALTGAGNAFTIDTGTGGNTLTEKCSALILVDHTGAEYARLTTGVSAIFAIPLRFTGTTHSGIRLNTLTSTQRDALTAVNGDIIYNSTTNAVNAYVGGSWVAL